MPNSTSSYPALLRLYLSHPRLGDGFRTAFVLTRKGDTATLFIPAYLSTLTVPAKTLGKAQPVSYRPRAIRANILARARTYRRYGHRFPRAATVRILTMLGARRSAIDECVHAPVLPQVTAAREQRALRRERLAELAVAATAIRERITLQRQAELPAPRRRKPAAHPDQLTLAL